MILYIWVPKDLGKKKKKLLELINKYNKVAGHKINTQKSIKLLYTNTEQSEMKI